MFDLGVAVAVIIFLDLTAIAAVTMMELSGGHEFVLMWEEESPLRPLLIGSLIVLFAAILSLVEVSVPGGGLRVNIGGAVVPLIATGLVLVRARPRAARVVSVTVVGTAASFAAAVLMGERFQLSWPAFLVVTVIVAIVSYGLARWKFYDAGALAYVGGTLGMFLGVDVAGLISLASSGPVEATLGANGILDLVFLAGIVALTSVWVLSAIRFLARRIHRASRPAA